MSLPDVLSDLEPCVHCGLCLQACPTYRATGDESDSPRGRIVLMRGLTRGEISAEDPLAGHHLDTCLGCRACEPVCPSGVRYGSALEGVRSAGRKARPESLSTRLLLGVLGARAIRAPLMRAAQIARDLTKGVPLPGAALGLLRGTRPHRRASSAPEPPEARLQPRRRERVCVFKGCVMDGLFDHVHEATKRVLRANGCELVEVPGQDCCGALHAHYGVATDAHALARRNIDAFRDSDCAIVVNAAGCGATLKEYERAGIDRGSSISGRVFDVMEFLAARETRIGGPLNIRVAYDPPCHLEHAQGVKNAPRSLLSRIPGIDLVEVPDGDQCCGSAGIFSLLQPDMSRSVLDAKVDAIHATGAEVVATGNPGCIMQIAAGLDRRRLPVSVVHPVELLDWSYREGGFYEGVM